VTISDNLIDKNELQQACLETRVKFYEAYVKELRLEHDKKYSKRHTLFVSLSTILASAIGASTLVYIGLMELDTKTQSNENSVIESKIRLENMERLIVDINRQVRVDHKALFLLRKKITDVHRLKFPQQYHKLTGTFQGKASEYSK